ncbi:hypothetical protein KY285_030276 [Solanum tuberosum]|nr:hypothetical protein KY285_030276 [Solanum tuberosum]
MFSRPRQKRERDDAGRSLLFLPVELAGVRQTWSCCQRWRLAGGPRQLLVLPGERRGRAAASGERRERRRGEGRERVAGERRDGEERGGGGYSRRSKNGEDPKGSAALIREGERRRIKCFRVRS